jgi:hypothetical protein
MHATENESPDDPLRALGITIRDSSGPASPEQLDVIERNLQCRLPAEYRSFLLRANGGVPAPRLFHFAVIDEDEGTRSRHWGKIARFYSAGPAEAPGTVPKNFMTLYENLVPYGLPDWLLPIAVVDDALDQGMLCIAVKGEKQGRIYYWPEQEIGEDTFHWVADSFNSFLALLGK